jgi:hypothetical protein
MKKLLLFLAPASGCFAQDPVQQLDDVEKRTARSFSHRSQNPPQREM